MGLSSQRYEPLGPIDNPPELVLLHGWGLSSVVWQSWLPALRELGHVTTIDLPGFGASAALPMQGLDKLLDQLLAEMPEQSVVLGFSLGGMLAVQLAARYPHRVQGVMTLASNARFTAEPSWPTAMAQATFDDFYQSAQQSLAITLKRFLALQAKGCHSDKALVKQLRALAAADVIEQQSALDLLALLSDLDNRAALAALSMPAVHLLAAGDELVPAAAFDSLVALGQSVKRVDDACHGLFLSHPEPCTTALVELLAQLPAARRCQKAAVARSFSRAAATYDDVAELQRQVGEQLLTYLPAKADIAMDLGCGTGYFLPALARATASQQLLAMDLAEGMLSYARSHQANLDCYWLGGDAEAIPLVDASVSVIFSSLAIQWCEDLPALFAEVKRVLKPGGCFVFATLGPNTLSELRTAWRAVDDYVHVNRFEERAMLQSAMAGFESRQLDEQVITLRYQRLTELTRELKSLGAHNVNTGRPSGLMGKAKLKLFREAYEAFRTPDDGSLPATYQVWYGSVTKPADTE